MYSRVCFFFFQAEDGIRDSSVTGVQTCALPISVVRRSNSRFRFAADEATARRIQLAQFRSEERRVGKGGRSRGAPYHLKKNYNSLKCRHGDDTEGKNFGTWRFGAGSR